MDIKKVSLLLMLALVLYLTSNNNFIYSSYDEHINYLNFDGNTILKNFTDVFWKTILETSINEIAKIYCS